MEIKTKYNLGDKCYRMVNNKPTELKIKSLYVAAGDKAVRESYTLVGEGCQFNDVTSQELDSKYYRSKSALMLATFPDLFGEEVRGVLLLNGKGGEQ